MKGFLLVVIGVLAVILVLGGATAFKLVTDAQNGGDYMDSNPVDKVVDKVNEATSSGSSVSEKVSDIVSEEVKFNAQNGEGYYREVTYSDGGFRQYDTKTGELIGSSYDSDQGKLPSME